MELGKIWNVKLTSSDETSMIISRLWDRDENKQLLFNTLCLDNWIDVWQGEGDKSKFGTRAYFGERAFSISLYISRYPETENIRALGLTFTKIKRDYTNKEYHVEDENTRILIKQIYKGVLENLNLSVDEENDSEFDTSLIMKAQSFAQRSDGYGRSTDYYIIGVKIRRWY